MRVLSFLVISIVGFTDVVSAQTAAQALTPGALRSYSNIYSIGVEWDVAGDADHDASAAVQYRVRGAGEWRPALPLVRVDSAVTTA